MKSIQEHLNESFTKNTYPYADDVYDDYIDEYVKQEIVKGRMSFVQPVFMTNVSRKEYAGWKYTITGDTVDDALYLYDNLGKYLKRINQPFKMGTKKLIESSNKEQAHKLMTIYIMNNTNVDYLLDDIKKFLKNYKCTYRLKYSEHVEGPIWKRVDTDEYGDYIPADPNKRKIYR